VTGTISNSATTVNTCTYSAQLSYYSFQDYYSGFTDFGNYALSMVMNMVTNTQNLINAMNAISTAETTCDLNTLYYNIGKIARYLT